MLIKIVKNTTLHTNVKDLSDCIGKVFVANITDTGVANINHPEYGQIAIFEDEYEIISK